MHYPELRTLHIEYNRYYCYSVDDINWMAKLQFPSLHTISTLLNNSAIPNQKRIIQNHTIKILKKKNYKMMITLYM